MPFISHPLIWLLRFRHRKGYGVHSPFAYNFITGVVNVTDSYYAYESLDVNYSPFHRRFSTLAISKSRLLYRLVNHAHPSRMIIKGASDVDRQYMLAAAADAHLIDENFDEMADFVYLAAPATDVLDHHLHEGSMLVLDNLQKHQTWWRMLRKDARTRVTFDLYDVGIAFFDSKYNKQDYVVNW